MHNRKNGLFKSYVNCILACIIAFDCLAQDTLNVNIVSRDDDNAKYAISMLKLGLEKSGEPFKLNVSSGKLSGSKMREELLSGSIDIIWVATDMDMEENALPIRIPLFKGLLGHRILIIHKDNDHLFDHVETFQQALKFKYGQGRGWPDTDIMRSNGMTVVTTPKYEGLFHMADGKRFDAFPRGVHEPWSEVSSRPELELAVDKNLMFVYISPYYLVASPARPKLAKAIEAGLLLAHVDGSFNELFLNNSMVKMVLEKAGLQGRRIFNIENSALPPKTPLDNKALWINISKLGEHKTQN